MRLVRLWMVIALICRTQFYYVEEWWICDKRCCGYFLKDIGNVLPREEITAYRRCLRMTLRISVWEILLWGTLSARTCWRKLRSRSCVCLRLVIMYGWLFSHLPGIDPESVAATNTNAVGFENGGAPTNRSYTFNLTVGSNRKNNMKTKNIIILGVLAVASLVTITGCNDLRILIKTE